MEDHKFTIEGYSNTEQALLFQDWFLLLAENKIEITGQGSSGDTWRLNLNSNQSIEISYSADTKSINVNAPAKIGPLVEKLSLAANQKITDRSPTPGSWWKLSFGPAQTAMDQSALLHMFRNLGAFRRGPDKLRMGRAALLHINDETDDKVSLFPKLNIRVHFISPGAAGGPLSKLLAERSVPVINAVLSSCFGSPLMPSASIFPLKPDEVETTVKEISSEEIKELGFQGLPIWGFLQSCFLLGASELADRIIGAMMAYESGMLQRTDHSTLLFFISSIESLTVPNLKTARPQRLSKRFSYFLEEFCSDGIEKIMNHSNFEEAFGKITSKKKFINELYNLRSQPVHTGHFGNYSGMFMADKQSLKVGLVNDIVVAAIEALIKRPVSLLWGHPQLDPSLTIRLEPSDFQLLKDQAEKDKTSIDEYVKNAIFTGLR